MRILVIGAGAVGSFLGARIGLAGHDVTLVGRRSFVEAVSGQGLRLIEPDGSERTAHVTAAESLAAAFQGGMPYDLALLTVKAYDTDGAIAELQHATSIPPSIVTLQNGVGNEEALAGAFGPDKVIAAAIETPVSVPSPGCVQVHRPRFAVGLAAVGQGAPLAAGLALLKDAGLDVSAHNDYRRLKWSKLLLNLPANAQCAILDWTPAQVMADPTASRMEARAWQEAFRVMQALRLRPLSLAAYPLPLIAPFARILPPSLLARALARTVSGGRGTKRPSLHIALAAGRRTEVGWLNGAVAREAQRLGLAAPVNKTFADTLAALTERRAAWEDWRGHPERILAAVGT